MKKVIFLSGSPNAEGNTVQVFKEAAKTIEAAGLQTEIISLAGMNIADAMNFKDAATDNFNEVIDKIKEADGLIVGGPVYWGTVNANLMNALQRIAMANMKDQFLSRMVGGPVVLARRGGMTSSLNEMLMFYLSNDMIVPGSTYWNMVMGQKPGEALEDAEGMQTIKRFAENVAFTINKISE